MKHFEIWLLFFSCGQASSLRTQAPLSPSTARDGTPSLERRLPRNVYGLNGGLGSPPWALLQIPLRRPEDAENQRSVRSRPHDWNGTWEEFAQVFGRNPSPQPRGAGVTRSNDRNFFFEKNQYFFGPMMAGHRLQQKTEVKELRKPARSAASATEENRDLIPHAADDSLRRHSPMDLQSIRRKERVPPPPLPASLPTDRGSSPTDGGMTQKRLEASFPTPPPLPSAFPAPLAFPQTPPALPTNADIAGADTATARHAFHTVPNAGPALAIAVAADAERPGSGSGLGSGSESGSVFDGGSAGRDMLLVSAVAGPMIALSGAVIYRAARKEEKVEESDRGFFDSFDDIEGPERGTGDDDDDGDDDLSSQASYSVPAEYEISQTP